MSIHKYDGLVLFDIDGTLTTGTENYKVVQHFLEKNYAVGITTAGSMYNPCNLTSFDWMPYNLYYFMLKRNFDTFNNVGTMTLCGKENSNIYEDKVYHLLFLIDDFKTLIGAFKGVSLEETALLYGITDPKKVILIDNDPYYLRGAFMYNKNFTFIPGGSPATPENLCLERIYKHKL
jgi:FMN phosphatase YigB (HAD superfamily)